MLIDFSKYDLPKELINELNQLKISFVFQNVYNREEQITAYEALMRPDSRNVLEVIEYYQRNHLLHILEIASFFGAFEEYERREYDQRISINSFPSEIFEEHERQCINEAFPMMRGRGIVEVLEYPLKSINTWVRKKEQIDEMELYVALDDFGSGTNDLNAVDFYRPEIVKVDRKLISGINDDEMKQKYCELILSNFHFRGMKVLAEGIETKAEYEWLKNAGFDYFQGYYLAVPK